MGVDTTENKEWNDRIEANITEDLKALQEEGMKTLLVGDFNGHIGERSGQADRNGRRVLGIKERGDLQIMNQSPKCKGRWTWMRRGSKSIIDYVMMDPVMATALKSMEIDEKGEKWCVGADHSWIQLVIDVGRIDFYDDDAENFTVIQQKVGNVGSKS